MNEIKWLWLKSNEYPFPRAVIYGIEAPEYIHELVIPDKIGGMNTILAREAFVSTAAPIIDKVIIPDRIEILPYAFRGAKIKTVIWPKHHRTIPEGCFMGSEINELIVNNPDHITSVGNKCFYGCKSLTALDWPTGCNIVPKECFSHSSLQELRGTEHISIIEDCAFNMSDLSIIPNLSGCRHIGRNSLHNTQIKADMFMDKYGHIWNEKTIRKAFYNCYEEIKKMKEVSYA